MRVVVEPAARHEGREIRRDGVEFEARHEQSQTVGVHADVGETCGSAGARRIGAPFRLLVSVGVDRQGQPILDISCVDDPNVAEFASFDHFARLAHHRIAGVVQSHRKNQPLCARELDQLGRFSKRRRQRLVADDVYARFEERFCDREVQVVRGDDDDGLDAIRARCLANRHFAIIRVGPVRRKTQDPRPKRAHSQRQRKARPLSVRSDRRAASPSGGPRR